MMRPPTKPKRPGAASRPPAKPKGPPADGHAADAGIRVACLPDPVKVIKKAGYPKRSVQDRLEECGMQYTQIGVKDVLAGKLTTDAYDVLCIPGGYAPNWCDKLGQKGSKLIEAFVASGGGFVGICAGAYLGSTWDLGLIDVDLPLIDRWARGRTDSCGLGLTKAAAEQLGEVAADPRLAVRYCNGPLMEAHDGVTVLATFESELRGRRNKYPAEMRGTAAIVSGRYSGEQGDGGRYLPRAGASVEALEATGRMLLKSIIDDHPTGRLLSRFVFEFLADSHERRVFLPSQPLEALRALEDFDPGLAKQWRRCVLEMGDEELSHLTLEVFEPSLGEGVVTRANVAAAVVAGCRRKLLLERQVELEALRRGFTFDSRMDLAMQLARSWVHIACPPSRATSRACPNSSCT